jgi:small subunit ribosomal protein S17
MNRAIRKSIIGVVESVMGKKSVKVVHAYKKPHPLYRKEISRQTVLHAHDEEGLCKVGDKVEIMQTRPMSKLKRWRVISIVEKAPVNASTVNLNPEA